MLEDEKKEEEEPAEENIGMNTTDRSVCNGDILCMLYRSYQEAGYCSGYQT